MGKSQKLRLLSLTVMIMVALVLAFLPIQGCAWVSRILPHKEPQSEKEGDKEPKLQTEIDLQDVPDEIRRWVDDSKRIFLGQSLDRDDLTYLLITWGEKPTGGYAVEVVGLAAENDEIYVACRSTEPSLKDSASQALTYPYDLVVVPRLRSPVRFMAEQGGPEYIPGLIGIKAVLPIVAESEWIKVFSPHPNQEVKDNFQLKGICNVFEGTVNFRLRRDEATLHEGFATGAMGDWGYFEATIPLDNYEAGPVQLEVFTYSPKDGSVRDLIQIPLTIID